MRVIIEIVISSCLCVLKPVSFLVTVKRLEIPVGLVTSKRKPYW